MEQTRSFAIGVNAMTFRDMLEYFKTEQKDLHITFSEKFSLPCRIVKTYDDFIAVNPLTFNKSEQAFNPTQTLYYIPNASIVLAQEHKPK